MYEQYREHCLRADEAPWSLPPFGHLLRYAFPGARVRRLGQRHQSKYHYYNIAVRHGSELARAVAATGDGATFAAAGLVNGTDAAGAASAELPFAMQHVNAALPLLLPTSDGSSLDVAHWPLPSIATTTVVADFFQGVRSQLAEIVRMPIDQLAQVRPARAHAGVILPFARAPH